MGFNLGFKGLSYMFEIGKFSYVASFCHLAPSQVTDSFVN